MWRAIIPSSLNAPPYDGSLAVTTASGEKPCDLSSFRISFKAARLFRRDCTSTSSTSRSQSRARHRYTFLPFDRDEDFIEMPTRISTRVRASEFSGIGQAKLRRPAADRFIRGINAVLSQHILYIAQAQRKAKVQPDRLLDHSGREAMTK